jgi:hypothetical protein
MREDKREELLVVANSEFAVCVLPMGDHARRRDSKTSGYFLCCKSAKDMAADFKLSFAQLRPDRSEAALEDIARREGPINVALP